MKRTYGPILDNNNKKKLCQQVCITEGPVYWGQRGGCISRSCCRCLRHCLSGWIEGFPGFRGTVERAVSHSVRGGGWSGGCGVLLWRVLFSQNYLGGWWGGWGDFHQKVPERRPACRTAPAEHLDEIKWLKISPQIQMSTCQHFIKL